MHPVYQIQPPIGYAPPTRPHDQTIPPPIGGVSNTFPTPPPIGAQPIGTVSQPPIGGAGMAQYQPPIGSEPEILIPSSTYQPPVGSTNSCVIIQQPIGADPETLINSTPITPQIGSYAGTNPHHPGTPPIGSAPVTLIPSVPITPPIGGPQVKQGYLAT